jgi:MSHA biogenesis protein MshJ
MKKPIDQYVEKINALAVRERALAFSSVVVVIVFAWWHFHFESMIADKLLVDEQNVSLAQQIQTLQITTEAIEKRINEGVHKAKQTQLIALRQELDRIEVMLQQKTLELVEPEEMFRLMQELLFAESKLKLTELRRKQVTPAFKLDASEVGQPQIYRHVLNMRFEGSFRNILAYLNRLEELDWKLMWDRINLRTDEYPLIQADIEISTLSDSKHWVGL